MMLSFDIHMEEDRKIWCPRCLALLLQPMCVEVFECPNCAIKLQAKGTTSRRQKRLAEQPSYDFYGGTPRQDIMLNNGQMEELLSEHESTNQQGQSSPIKQSETLLVPETQKNEDSKFQHPSAMLGATMNKGWLVSLDPVYIDTEASNAQKESLQQSPNKIEAQAPAQDKLNNDETEEGMPEDESINQDKTVSVLENLVKEESMLPSYSAMSIVIVNEARLASSDSIGINETGTKITSPNFLSYTDRDATAGSKETECPHGEEMLSDYVMQQNCLDENSETQLFSQSETICCELVGGDCLIAEGMECTNEDEGTLGTDNGLVTARPEINDISSECEGVEEPFQEGNSLDENNGGQFDSQIIRDNDNELSFKYIASPLKSNLLPEEKKKVNRLAKLPSEVAEGNYEIEKRPCLSLELSFSSVKGSDDCESCPSYSGSLSHGDLDSEFDFPSPSAESTHLTKQSDSYFKSNVLGSPQQLGWQYADADANDEYNMVARDQESNCSIASGIEIVCQVASVVEAHTDAGGKEDIEDGLPTTCDRIMSKALHESKTTDVVLFSQAQSKRFAQSQALLEERFADENGIFVSSTDPIRLECENKDSFVDSVDCKEKSCGKANGELLEPSGSYGDQILNLKPLSILREDCQPLGKDLSTGTLSHTSQMKMCSTVKDPKLIKSDSNQALDDSAFRMHDNVGDTLYGDKREEGQVVSPIAHCGGYAANDHSGLQKKWNTDGVYMPYRSEQLRVSQNGSESERHHAWDPFHKKGQVHNKAVEVLEISDKKQCHKRNNSSYAEQSLSHKDAGNQEYQENIYDEDLYPPAQRTLEGSFGMQEGHAQARSMLAGSSLHAQDSQADLYMTGQTFNNNAFSSFPASSFSYGSDASFDKSRSSGNPACSYQAPTLPYGLPIAMHGHPFSHDIYHPVCPVCVPHFPGQGLAFPHLPVHSCIHCLKTVGHYQGHPKPEPHHCGFQGKGSCMLCHSFRSNPREIAHMHDTALIAAKASRSSVNKPKKYPPLPQGGMAPYVICRHCNDILEVSVCFSSSKTQKLRCGACRKVSKFSVNQKAEKLYIAGLQPSAERLPSKSSRPAFEWMANRREQTFADLGQNKKSSYGESFLVQNKRGSVSSRDLMRGHHNSKSDMTFKIKPSLDICDAKLPTHRNEPNSQDEFFFRNLSRKSEFGSSRSLFSGFKTISSKLEPNHVHERVDRNGDTSLQCLVDEKEEGLDFGAPRPSDDDSLDQRSPEKFDTVDQPMQTSSIAEEKSWASEIQPEFQSEGRTTDPMRSRLTLFALFNKESTKFRIPLGKDIFEESPSRLWSPVQKPMNKKTVQIEKEIASLNVKKGPRHIAAMLTRSWKHQARN